MATWDEIAKDNLWTAKMLQRARREGSSGDCSRTIVSRCYYSAFSAVAHVLQGKAHFRVGRETPDHQLVSGLLQRHMGEKMEQHRLRDLRAAVRRLYSARLDADYRSRVDVPQLVLNAVRDASKVLRELGVPE